MPHSSCQYVHNHVQKSWDSDNVLPDLKVTRAAKTKLVALNVLHHKVKFVHHLYEGNSIQSKDYEALQVITVILQAHANGRLGEPQPRTVQQHWAAVMEQLDRPKSPSQEFARTPVLTRGTCVVCLQEAIIRKTNLLQWSGFDGKLPEPKELMHSTSLFCHLDMKDFETAVVPAARHRLFQDGDALFRQGDTPLMFYIVIRGSTKR